mgnify:CR=1 FL=1
MPYHLNFEFPAEVLAVLAIRYMDADQRGNILSPYPQDLDAKAKEHARILREINPEVVAVLTPVGVGFVPPGEGQVEIHSSKLYLVTKAPRILRGFGGKFVTFGSSENDGPVLLVWKGEPLDPKVFEEFYKESFATFANAAARVIGGVDRIQRPYSTHLKATA